MHFLSQFDEDGARTAGVTTCVNLSDCDNQQPCLAIGVCQRSKQSIRTLGDAQAERERCARIAESFDAGGHIVVDEIAAAIRKG